MTTFFGNVYKLISLPIQGIWRNEKQKFEFRIEDKKDKTPGNIIDLILYIDDEQQGVVEFNFSSLGVVSLLINGTKTYEIGSMYWNDENEQYTLALKDSKNVIILQKQ